MARARGKSGVDPLDDGDGDDIQEFVPAGSLPPPVSFQSPETDAERKTEDIWERLGGADDAGTGYLTVHKVQSGGGGSTEQFVEKIPADKYDYDSLLEYLRETYKGGDYRVRLYVKHARGNYVMRGNRLASILKPDDRAVSPIREVAARSSAPDMVSILATFDAMQQRSQKQMEDLMEKMMRRMDQPSQKNTALEFVEILTALTTAITPIATLISNTRKREADPVDSLAKLMTITGQVKGLMPVPAETEPEPVWAGVIKAAIEALPGVMAARAGQQRLALPPKPTAPARPVRGPAVPPQPPLEEEMPEADTMTVSEQGAETGAHEVIEVDRTVGDVGHPLYAIVCDLLTAAKNGADPEEVAKQVMENADPAHRPVIAQFLGQDSLPKVLSEIHPDVLDEVEWVLDLRDCVLDLLDGANEG